MWGKCPGQNSSKTGNLLSFCQFIFYDYYFFVMKPLNPLSFVEKHLNIWLINKTF